MQKPVLAGRAEVKARAENLANDIAKLRARRQAAGQADAADVGTLEAREATARDLARWRGDAANTAEELKAVETEIKKAEDGLFNLEVSVGRAEVARRVDAAGRRITALRERMPQRDRLGETTIKV